jgi:hypothetical protein
MIWMRIMEKVRDGQGEWSIWVMTLSWPVNGKCRPGGDGSMRPGWAEIVM